MDTTNVQTKVQVPVIVDPEALLVQLAEKRMIVESRGDPAEYIALAREYAQAGFEHNAASLYRKAQGMIAQRGVRHG